MAKFQALVLISFLLLILNHSSFAQLSAYTRADRIADLYPHHSLKDLNVLSQKLTATLNSDEEKFRAIFRWVCVNIATNNGLVDLHRAKRKELSGHALEKWNHEMNDRMLKMLIEDQETLCTGYAWLVKELARRAGIRCEIINGYGRRIGSNVDGPGFANHSWNAVRLNGQWRLCDPAWSAGFVDLSTESFNFQFEDVYFLTDPKYFILNHYPLDTTWTFLEYIPSLETFLTDPVSYVNAIKYKVLPCGNFRSTISPGDEVGFFVHTDYSGPMSYIIGASAPRPMIMNTLRNNSKQFYTRQRLKRRGTFPVHILIGDQFIASYEVTVK